jgi:exosome complex component CSL4
MPDIAVPGQVLTSTSSHLAGPGTHVYENNILASILGSTVTTPAPSRSSKPTISVPRCTPNQSILSTPTNGLPSVNSIVLCRVTRVQQRQLMASIILTDPSPSTTIPYPSATNDELQFQAILRKEDVRAYEKDKVVMNEMYRTGDIIRATVISLGDERSYYISTGGNELGVLISKSEAGNAMVPASWREMRDVVTGKGESRKVAKPA